MATYFCDDSSSGAIYSHTLRVLCGLSDALRAALSEILAEFVYARLRGASPFIPMTNKQINHLQYASLCNVTYGLLMSLGLR